MTNNIINNLTDDIQYNTKLLLETPGLAETLSLSIGNAIFNPRAETDINNPYKTLTLNIDNSPVIIITADSSTPRSVQPVPATCFSYEGIKFLFKHGGIPLQFKQVVLLYAKSKNDLSVLNIAFDQEEQKLLLV